MEALKFATHIGTPLEIDACWSCQVIWFDHLESSSLSASSVIELFKRIHAARDVPRNIVAQQSRCPRCEAGLSLTKDLGRGGQFSYYRCPNGDGRLISFTQFLREKNFIRTLNPTEVQAMAVKIRQIRCSSCGAGIDLQKDTACSHCGSPISVLDEQAVTKALAEYAARATARPAPVAVPYAQQTGMRDRATPWPEPQNTGAAYGWSAGDLIDSAEVGGVLVDLVGHGISSLFD
jgi:hypothetical protein